MAVPERAWPVGGFAVAAERLPVFHLSQRRRRSDGTVHLLVAGPAGDSLAEISRASGV